MYDESIIFCTDIPHQITLLNPFRFSGMERENWLSSNENIKWELTKTEDSSICSNYQSI